MLTMKKTKNKTLIKGQKKADRLKISAQDIIAAIGIAWTIEKIAGTRHTPISYKKRSTEEKAKIIDLNPEDYEEIKP